MVATVGTDPLVSGRTKSCGCLAIDGLRARSVTHGARIGRAATRTYKSWSHAKARCANPSDAKYRIYGGRGIAMCAQWRDDFAAFLRDMGECPPGLTLDRKDVNGDYSPENCRWATPRQQSNNTRRNIVVCVDGASVTLSEAAALLGLPYKWLHARMRAYGMPFESAVGYVRAAIAARG